MNLLKKIAILFLLANLWANVEIDSDFYFDGYRYSFTNPDPQGFIINDTPLITVMVKGNNLDANKFRLLIDNVSVLEYSPWNYSYNRVDGLFSFQVKTPLSIGSHKFTFFAQDADSKVTKNFFATVKANEISLLDNPLPFPSPATTSVNISYRLQKTGDLKLFIYDIKGQLIFTEQYDDGGYGSRPGYNELALDVTSWRNGVYIALITADINKKQKIIGKTKFIVAK